MTHEGLKRCYVALVLVFNSQARVKKYHVILLIIIIII